MNPSVICIALDVYVVGILGMLFVVWVWKDQPGFEAMYVESTVMSPVTTLLNMWGKVVV